MMDRQLVILYGSQTGTAMDLAKRIRKQGKLRHFSTSLLAMNDFPIHRLASTPLVVFVCSVTGQGDEPDNMKTFWRALRRRDLPAVLDDVQFAVLGIGDSSYQNFNITAIRLDRRLRKLGARPFVKIGLADESHDHGIDFVADPWIAQLMDTLMEKFPLPPGQEFSLQDETIQPSFNVHFLSEKPVENKSWSEKQMPRKSGLYDADHPFQATLISNKRATAEDHFQNVRFMKFDLASSGMSYAPGDTVNVFPKNLPEAVYELLTFLELDGDQLISLSINDEDFSLPPHCRLSNPCTIREAATNYWDFQGVPRKSFFELLTQIAQDEREKERLTEFASAAGANDLFDYCFRPRRNALEILQDFSDTAKRISLPYFFDLFPPIQARAFSIASSARYHKDELHLLVAVVEYKTKLHRPRKGLCSNWLASLQPGRPVPLWVKKGTIKFEQTKDKPVVMVGPGTGVAPFRSFIYERVSLAIGNSILFFGCRNKAKDFYFEEEWKVLQGEGFLTVLPPAFSRDQEEKVYVQDSIRKAGAVVVKALVEDEGFFYLAGSANSMPKEVEAALKTVLCQHADMKEEEALEYIKQLVSEGRYQTETWS
ncbi:hypothetical protein RvY_08310 [Ramazzottius varieornatus]|uniref:NADPH-dependent diflavin oxidoreductase 1 n=1 Tax=Ramazzottius varieornatus TaxID=947166 RepID=A0A1D1V5E7_RAMVA|nr:hypothetical protein RvY_08310 [Ramazzottius varieornatus]